MRSHLIMPFIFFLLKKMFSGVIEVNKKYRREMERMPALMIFVGTICSTLYLVVSSLIVISTGADKDIIRYAFLLNLCLCVCYIIYTFFSIQFNDFLEERQEMFDIIKDEQPTGRRRF
jgi:uncharacterized protein YacL